MSGIAYLNIDGFVQRYTYSGVSNSSSVEKILLSASPFGRQILITGSTTGEATILHEAPAGSGYVDEVYLYAYNNKASGDVALTLYWGDLSTAGEDKIDIPYRAARYQIMDGKLIQNGLKIYATNEIVI